MIARNNGAVKEMEPSLQFLPSEGSSTTQYILRQNFSEVKTVQELVEGLHRLAGAIMMIRYALSCH